MSTTTENVQPCARAIGSADFRKLVDDYGKACARAGDIWAGTHREEARKLRDELYALAEHFSQNSNTMNLRDAPLPGVPGGNGRTVETNETPLDSFETWMRTRIAQDA